MHEGEGSRNAKESNVCQRRPNQENYCSCMGAKKSEKIEWILELTFLREFY